MEPGKRREIQLIDSLRSGMIVKDYLDALGLATDPRTTGKHRFLDSNAQQLYQSVTDAVTNSTLPTELPNLRLVYLEPDCFKHEAESMISSYGFIWGNDDRRSTQNDLSISRPNDRATIKIMLRCLIAKRLYKARVDLIAKTRKQKSSHSSTTLPKPLSRAISTNSATEVGVPNTMISPCGDDGPDSDDSETFVYYKAESYPSPSPDTETTGHGSTPHVNATLEASTNHQDDAKDDAPHMRDKREHMQKKKGPPPYMQATKADLLSTRAKQAAKLFTTPSKKGSHIGLGKNTTLKDLHMNTALGQERDTWVDDRTHAGEVWDIAKEIKLETESLLQQVAFDELVEVLKVSNPQGSDTINLSIHAWNLSTPETHERMKAALGSTILKEAYEAMLLWHKIHAKLHEFRRSTNYAGKAGADWQAHKQTLRVISWKEASLPAVAAHRQLGLFVVESERCGEWVAARPDEFASRVACYYATLLQAPNVYAEDLVDGFQEYNVELLKWFKD